MDRKRGRIGGDVSAEDEDGDGNGDHGAKRVRTREPASLSPSMTMPAQMPRTQLELAYAGAAVAHRFVTHEERQLFDNANVRTLNNFVKAFIIDIATRTHTRSKGRAEPLRVCDVACGRGQDISKWKYAAQAAGVVLQRYVGLDLVPEDVRASSVMAQRFFVDGATHAEFVAADMAAAFPFASASCNVVTCQLALHYLCDSQARLTRFFDEAARVLPRAAGVLLLSFTDGRAIVRRARDALDVDADPTSTIKIKIRRRYYEIELDAASAQYALASPFGHAYTFTMHGSVASVPEFLCSEGVLHKAATRAGFLYCGSRAFDASALAWLADPSCRAARIAAAMHNHGSSGQHDADALDAASLYRWAAFVRSAAERDAWRAAMADEAAPIPCKQRCEKVW